MLQITTITPPLLITQTRGLNHHYNTQNKHNHNTKQYINSYSVIQKLLNQFCYKVNKYKKTPTQTPHRLTQFIKLTPNQRLYLINQVNTLKNQVININPNYLTYFNKWLQNNVKYLRLNNG